MKSSFKKINFILLIILVIFLFFSFSKMINIKCNINIKVIEYLTENKDSSLMYENSDFIEKEQPTLTDKTKELIANYQKEANLDNFLKLRLEVINNYNAKKNKEEI